MHRIFQIHREHQVTTEVIHRYISEYVSVNHLPGSEGKCYSRKTLLGRCKIEQESPGSECVVLTRHREPGLTEVGGICFPFLLVRKPESEVNKVISTAPMGAGSDPGLTIPFLMQCSNNYKMNQAMNSLIRNNKIGFWLGFFNKSVKDCFTSFKYT